MRIVGYAVVCPKLLEELGLGRVKDELPVMSQHPALRIARSHTPCQRLQLLRVLPTPSKASLVERHQCAHSKHEGIAFVLVACPVRESADASVLAIMYEIAGAA